jgi:hypothetical protein
MSREKWSGARPVERMGRATPALSETLCETGFRPVVAYSRDRGTEAVAWLRAGRPGQRVRFPRRIWVSEPASRFNSSHGAQCPSHPPQ